VAQEPRRENRAQNRKSAENPNFIPNEKTRQRDQAGGTEMMIYRCDRCGNLMNKPSTEIQLNVTLYFFLKLAPTVQLCEDCTKAFEQFRQGIATKGVKKEEE
jgi:hypothetical protein